MHVCSEVCSVRFSPRQQRYSEHGMCQKHTQILWQLPHYKFNAAWKLNKSRAWPVSWRKTSESWIWHGLTCALYLYEQRNYEIIQVCSLKGKEQCKLWLFFLEKEICNLICDCSSHVTLGMWKDYWQGQSQLNEALYHYCAGLTQLWVMYLLHLTNILQLPTYWLFKSSHWVG